MIRLDRSTVQVPESWADTAATAFPDAEAFRRRAEEFEALDIDHPDRRKGFAEFAPEVLPKVKKKPGFQPLWSKVKSAIAKISHRKCAYCETKPGGPRASQVEHFRPKSLFPKDAYDWDNYLLGCADCNGMKLDRWPAKGRSFVRPDGDEDPEALFEFLEDGTIRAVEHGSAAAATIPAFGLDREWLCDERELEISWTLEELDDLIQQNHPEETLLRLARKILVRISDPRRRYSAALRRCFLRAWMAKNLPDLGL